MVLGGIEEDEVEMKVEVWGACCDRGVMECG